MIFLITKTVWMDYEKPEKPYSKAYDAGYPLQRYNNAGNNYRWRVEINSVNDIIDICKETESEVVIDYGNKIPSDLIINWTSMTEDEIVEYCKWHAKNTVDGYIEIYNGYRE